MNWLYHIYYHRQVSNLQINSSIKYQQVLDCITGKLFEKSGKGFLNFSSKPFELVLSLGLYLNTFNDILLVFTGLPVAILFVCNTYIHSLGNRDLHGFHVLGVHLEASTSLRLLCYHVKPRIPGIQEFQETFFFSLVLDIKRMLIWKTHA